MGLISWWRNRGKVSLSVAVSAELLQLYKAEAEREGLGVEDWARRALNRAIPISEVRRIEESARLALGLAEGPAFIPPKVTPTGAHPCRYLKIRVMPPNYAPGECQGTCSSPDRNFANRPCHWSATRAVECAGFKSLT